ncbi:MAG: hypothetical protein H7Z17_16600, partial [Fuerstia sp.]|nr:hypothetical protein [Fuerstiella sp.]
MLLARGAMPQGEGTETPAGVRSALGTIFADDHVAQEALQVHDRAMLLDEAARFELLSTWVLPSDDHNSLRMQCEFTPTCPAPMFERSGDAASESSGSEHRQFTGGDLVSPVMDLVSVAARLNRLEEIRNVIDQWQVTSREDQKSRIVFKLLIAITQKDSDAAELQMREIL